MWNFFIKNNRFSYLLLFILLIFGGYSLISIPKESSPEVVIPIGIVSTVYPGANALEVENFVTNKIEQGLKNLNNVKKITSTSKENISTVVVEFLAEADLNSSINDLKDEIDLIKPELPEDSKEPIVDEVNFVNEPILTLAVSTATTGENLADLSKELESEIKTVTGVSKVNISGIADKEITVIVNQTSLLKYNITLNDIISALKNANTTLPVGRIVNNDISYNIAFNGDLNNIEDIYNLPITTRGGQPVYVRDVAVVKNGFAPSQTLFRLSLDSQPSQPALAIDIFKQAGGDVTKITKALHKKMKELSAPGKLLESSQVVTVLDKGKTIADDLFRLSVSGLQTVFLVIILLVIAIGWREGLLAGLAIPLSFLFGFIGLYYSGNTINFLSLFALILGVGILVDTAIVIIEGINRKLKENPNLKNTTAANLAVQEFSAPLISGTLTTVAMFVGLFIVSGVIGQFIASIPFTLIFILLSSLFVALAILPLLASRFLKNTNNDTNNKLTVWQEKYNRKLEDWYKQKLSDFIYNEEKQWQFLSILVAGLIFSLTLIINVWLGLIATPIIYLWIKKTYKQQKQYCWSEKKRNLLGIMGVILIMAVLFITIGKILPTHKAIKVVFFEQSDVDYIMVDLKEPIGTVKEITDLGIRRAEEILYHIPEIKSFTTTVGKSSQFKSKGGETNERLANIFINLKLDRQRTSTEIMTDLRQRFSELSDLDLIVSQPTDGPPAGAAIIIKIFGNDLTQLSDTADKIVSIFKAVPGTINVQSETDNNSTEFVLNLDKDKTSKAGLNPFLVSQILRTAVYGSAATTLTTPEDDIDVVVKLNIGNSDNVSTETNNHINLTQLEKIILPTPTGSITLASLVTSGLRESNTVINHENGTRVLTVTSDITPDANAREIQAQILKKIETELNLPNGVTVSTDGGENAESNKAFLEMLFALILGVALMLVVLILQFNSFLYTKYVLSILPYSLIGIMFGLAITFNPLSFPSIMGFIALSGIVVNNSILLINTMNNKRQKNPDHPIPEVVIESATQRLRPILLTTITTIIGMIPLTYAGDIWVPLAYAVIFGLIFSVLITLILIPIIYVRNPGKLTTLDSER